MTSKFLRSMYNKTIIKFGFCDIQNNQGLSTGSPHIRLEQTTFIGPVLCFVSANFYYARGTRGLLVRGLEPKLRNRSEPARI